MAPYMDDMNSPEPARREPAPGPTSGGRDELDDLFDYDVELDDIFGDKPTATTNGKSKTAAPGKDKGNAGQKGRGAGAGLGLDEAIVLDKKLRAPRVKLDEDKLRSKAGIPRLRERAKNLKFKGKGHEYSDAARLLQFYQLWLDDLFPKAKFLDAAAMVEKLGHKRGMQIMRQSWIDEGKPKSTEFEQEGGASIFDEPTLPPREESLSTRPQTEPRLASIFEPQSRSNAERLKTPDVDQDMDEDIYGATPKGQRSVNNDTSGDGQVATVSTSGTSGSIFGPKKTDSNANANDEPEDDLDALLAEQEMQGVSASVQVQRNDPEPEADFDDEMEAWRELEEM